MSELREEARGWVVIFCSVCIGVWIVDYVCVCVNLGGMTQDVAEIGPECTDCRRPAKIELIGRVRSGSE